MFKIIGGTVVYGFAVYGLMKFMQRRCATGDED